MEQRVVLTTDPQRARATGRPTIEKPYLGLVNYINNLRTLGFDDSDFTDGGSDRLIDALVVSGDASSVAAGLRRHLDAGADHVTVQLLTTAGDDPTEQYAALAGALFDH
jgi:probable F420-dependent oxidoreductase